VWYSPGSVQNVAGGHASSRSVAVTGNVRLSFTTTAASAEVVFWVTSGTPRSVTGQVQYYNSAWVKLRQDLIETTVDSSWSERSVSLNQPSGTTYVIVGLWIGDAVTFMDDVELRGGSSPPPPQPSPAPLYASTSLWR